MSHRLHRHPPVLLGLRKQKLAAELHDKVLYADAEMNADAEVRLREHGHVFAGEVLVVPNTEDDLLERVAQARERLLEHSWQLHDLVVVPVPRPESPCRREETAARTP